MYLISFTYANPTEGKWGSGNVAVKQQPTFVDIQRIEANFRKRLNCPTVVVQAVSELADGE